MEHTFASAPETTNSIPAVITEEFLSALRNHGVVEAALFGSVADGTATPESDIDLLVTFAQPMPLFDQLRLADELQGICGRPVDLMTDIHPAFRPYILPTLIPLSLPTREYLTS